MCVMSDRQAKVIWKKGRKELCVICKTIVDGEGKGAKNTPLWDTQVELDM